jgi:hypothetical protein
MPAPDYSSDGQRILVMRIRNIRSDRDSTFMIGTVVSTGFQTRAGSGPRDGLPTTSGSLMLSTIRSGSLARTDPCDAGLRRSRAPRSSAVGWIGPRMVGASSFLEVDGFREASSGRYWLPRWTRVRGWLGSCRSTRISTHGG